MTWVTAQLLYTSRRLLFSADLRANFAANSYTKALERTRDFRQEVQLLQGGSEISLRNHGWISRVWRVPGFLSPLQRHASSISIASGDVLRNFVREFALHGSHRAHLSARSRAPTPIRKTINEKEVRLIFTSKIKHGYSPCLLNCRCF